MTASDTDRCAFCDRLAGMIVWHGRVLCSRCYVLWIVERKDPEGLLHCLTCAQGPGKAHEATT